jgi:hypothetical protein
MKQSPTRPKLKRLAEQNCLRLPLLPLALGGYVL